MNSIVSVSGNNGTTVTINGKTYKLPAGSVNVVDGKIYHNGKLVDDFSDAKKPIYNIMIFGDNNNISTNSGDITVNGNAGSVTTQSGDIEISRDVNGDVKTTSGDITVNGNAGSVITQSGDIEISHDVNGDVKTTNGDINIKGNVYGQCSAVSGDIKAKRIDENGVTKDATTGNFFGKLSNLFI